MLQMLEYPTCAMVQCPRMQMKRQDDKHRLSDYPTCLLRRDCLMVPGRSIATFN